VEENWAWDKPFKLTFSDGQQPQRPVEVFVDTPGDILDKRIVLCHLASYEEGGREEKFIDHAYYEEDEELKDLGHPMHSLVGFRIRA